MLGLVLATYSLVALQAPASGTAPDSVTALLKGVIVDGITGQPVEGATIQVGGRATANSGPDGRFEFHLAPGGYRIDFRKTGYIGTNYPSVRARVEQISSGENRVRLQIMPAAALSGRILGEDGAPLAGVLIYARQEDQFSAIMDTSAADGSYRLEDLAPAAYALELRAPEALRRSKRVTADGVTSTYLPVTWHPGATERGAATQVPLAAGQALSGFDIRLRRFRVSTLTVEATDAASREPVAGLSVRLRARGDIDYAETRTDEAGRARFDWIAPSDYSVELAPASDGSALPFIATVAVAPPSEEAHVKVPRWAALRGKVVQSDGSPGRATVSIGPRMVSVAEDGTFEILAPPGQWRVRVRTMSFPVRGAAPRTTYVAAATYGDTDALANPIVTSEGGNPELRIVLAEGGRRITGRVLDDRDEPAAHELIRAIRHGVETAVYTGADGYFEITSLAPGEYALTVGQNCDAGRVDATEGDIRLPSPLRVCSRPRP